MVNLLDLCFFIILCSGICVLLSLVEYGYTKWQVKRKSKPLN